MLSKQEAQKLLERMIFEEMNPQDWAQDVWDFNPIHGDSAIKLFEAFTALIQMCSDERLEAYLHSLYQNRIDG